MMMQAPEPGMDVEIVPADFGAGFAGAVRIYPRVAAAVAGNPGRLNQARSAGRSRRQAGPLSRQHQPHATAACTGSCMRL